MNTGKMPVERKNRNLRRYEPPSPSLCSSDEEERDKFFLGNPDFEFDELPQPFKNVDKILELILDAVSDEIVKVEELNVLKKAAKKVPIFATPVFVGCPTETRSIADFDDVCEVGHSFEAVMTSLTASVVYIAKKTNIYAIDLLTNKHLGSLKLDSDADISLVKTISVTAPETDDSTTNYIDLIFAFNNDGRLFVHAFNMRCFLFLWASSEQQSISSKVEQCDFCMDKNMFYLKRLNHSSGYSAEIYKIPKENWVQELVQAFRKIETVETEKNCGEEDDQNDLGETHQDSKQEIEVEDEQENNNLPQPSSSSLINFNFSQLVLLMSISVPTENPNAASGNLYSLMKSIDLSRVGNGEKHPLSIQFFDILGSKQYEELKDYLPISEIKDAQSFETQGAFPTVHFLLGTEVLQSGEMLADEDRSCKHELIGIWWSTKNKFLVYSLPKSGRDTEKYQLEAVYPNSDIIFASSVSNDTKLIALALKSRNVVVWDRLQGTPSKILTWGDDIDYFLFGQRNVCDKLIDVLLIGSRTGHLQQISCNDDNFTERPLADNSLITQSDVLHITVIHKLGWLVFVARSPNKITAFDLDASSAICHFQLPEEYVISDSPDGCLIVDANATKLCVLVKKQSSNQEPVYGIFAFNICTFCNQSSDLHCSSAEDVASVTTPAKKLDKVMVSLMTGIRNGQKEIEDRQKKRWKQYYNELKISLH